MSKTPRSSAFRNNIVRAFSYKCTLTGMDELQCEAAHIIPHKNNDTEPNGMLLSVDIHRLYDKWVWCPIPSTRRPCPYRQNFVSYDIEISDKYNNKHLSINNHKYKRIEVKAWSHEFIQHAYQDFRRENYPEEFLNEEIIEEKENCEYCNELFTKRGLKKHQNTCSKNERRRNN